MPARRSLQTPRQLQRCEFKSPPLTAGSSDGFDWLQVCKRMGVWACANMTGKLALNCPPVPPCLSPHTWRSAPSHLSHGSKCKRLAVLMMGLRPRDQGEHSAASPNAAPHSLSQHPGCFSAHNPSIFLLLPPHHQSCAVPQPSTHIAKITINASIHRRQGQLPVTYALSAAPKQDLLSALLLYCCGSGWRVAEVSHREQLQGFQLASSTASTTP